MRNAGGPFNRIETNSAQVAELKEVCEMYFNVISLFCPSSANVTTWTVGYAIPYHANLLFKLYKVGYGIVSLQAKDAKHSGVKDDLTLTNKSTAITPIGKWWQVMRTMFAPFICQNISPCPPLILYTTSLAPHPIVTNQSFVNVVEIKTEMSSVVTSVCLALRL